MSRARDLSPADRRRIRWLSRCLIALDDAPDAYRLATLDVARRLNAGHLSDADADALAATLGGLILDTLEFEPDD